VQAAEAGNDTGPDRPKAGGNGTSSDDDRGAPCRVRVPVPVPAYALISLLFE